ncbi:hypothetical protein M5K25_016425 [Dendrobium thyrsiflorum]|uniref:Uncharacterized protein n=1 Tax=Dendrobium thyrsiflorum TaxID=117978 RepID=A0ABD0URK9_DENTH
MGATFLTFLAKFLLLQQLPDQVEEVEKTFEDEARNIESNLGGLGVIGEGFEPSNAIEDDRPAMRSREDGFSCARKCPRFAFTSCHYTLPCKADGDGERPAIRLYNRQASGGLQEVAGHSSSPCKLWLLECLERPVVRGEDDRREKDFRLYPYEGVVISVCTPMRELLLVVARGHFRFDAIGEHTGSGHNHNLVVPFGGESPGSEGPGHRRPNMNYKINIPVDLATVYLFDSSNRVDSVYPLTGDRSNLFKSKFTVQFKCRSPIVQKLFKSLSFLDKISAASRRLPRLGEISRIIACLPRQESRAQSVSGDTAAVVFVSATPIEACTGL